MYPIVYQKPDGYYVQVYINGIPQEYGPYETIGEAHQVASGNQQMNQPPQFEDVKQEFDWNKYS